MIRCLDLPDGAQLLLQRPIKAQHVSIVVDDLERPESIVTEQCLIPACFGFKITIEELVFALPEVCHRRPFEPMGFAFIAK